jgi:tripartite-type tricarboxylate transporter receptor subunit TctC
MRQTVYAVLAWTLAASSAATAAPIAQAYPSKVVRLVVPFAAGGSNDVVARAMSVPLGRALGQSVVVENRPGGDTIIGTEVVARAPADGHTVLISGFTFASLAALRANLPFDPLRDFAAVTGLGTQPYVISVHPSLPARSVKDLIALARARPGQLVYAINGHGTGQHLSGELLKTTMNIDMKYVAFSGGGPATAAVLGGHAGILISTAPPIIQHVQTDKLRALAVTSRTRSSLLKDVPTMIESGLPNFDMAGAMGVFAPAATPRAAIDRLSSEIMRVVQLPEVKEGMLRDGFAVVPLGPAEYDAAIRAKVQQIQQIARAAKLKID